MSGTDLEPAETVTVQRTYTASVDAAFEAWTSPAALEQWFGPPGFRAKVLSHELRVGGGWRFRMVSKDGDAYHHFGRFLEIDAPHRLVFTWASEEQVDGWRDVNGDPTRVTVTFKAVAAGVTVTVTHQRLATALARQALTGGWGGGLVCLEGFLHKPESGRWAHL